MAQKRPNSAKNMFSWAHIGHAGSFGAPLVGGCGAQAVSRKTPVYFIDSDLDSIRNSYDVHFVKSIILII